MPKVYLLWFVGAVVCLIVGMQACDLNPLNPHPLPPGAEGPANGAEDASSSNASSSGLSLGGNSSSGGFGGSSSSGGMTSGVDAGIAEPVSEEGGAHDANLGLADAPAAEAGGDGGVANPSDAPSDAPPDGVGEADAANSTEGGE